MNPAHLITLTGTLTHRTGTSGVDEYHNPTPTTTSSSVYCWFEQVRAEESTTNTATQDETHRLFFRAGTAVGGHDSLVVSGKTFQILGPPWEAINPRTGVASHIEAKGRQVV